MKKYVYHGSKIQGMKVLTPKEAGYNKSFVYATTNPAFSAIFINRPGGSFTAGFKKISGVVNYWERKKGVFNKNYKNQKGSIYVLDAKDFHKDKKIWKEERIANKPVKVLKEIKINDLKHYLLALEKQNKFKFISFKDRLKYFPKDEKKMEETCMDMLKKYGRACIPSMKKYRLDLYKKSIKKYESLYGKLK